jgi:hypothetical protein
MHCNLHELIAGVGRDLQRNELTNALQVYRSVIERIVSRVFSVPMVRFLGMQRAMSWLVSNSEANGPGKLV